MQDFVAAFFNFLAAYRFIIMLGIVGLTMLKLFGRELMNEWGRRWHHKWVEKRDRKKEKQKLKKQKKVEIKEKNKHRTYKANNWLYNDIVQYRTIMFRGFPRAGKTSGAMNVAKFLIERILFNERKNRRYYEVMDPEFLKRRDKLKDNGLLPMYTNLDNVRDMNSGLLAMNDAEDIVLQRKKANTPCVVVLDEASDLLGKDNYREVQNEKDPSKRADNEGAKQTAKKLGHIDMWLFMTDQGGGDVVYTVRNIGYPEILYRETKRELSPKGKKVQKKLLRKIKWLPGWFVSKPKLRFAECLFEEQKKKVFWKLFLRGSKQFERQYFTTRNEIYKKVNLRYIIWKQLFDWKGKTYWVHYNNRQTLLYDHQEFRSEYNNKFDAAGNRKSVV